MELPSTYRPNFDSDLLQGLSEQQKLSFLADCTIRHYPQPKDLLQQGLTTETFFIVDHGQVEVSYIDPNGNSFVVFIANPGEVLGDVEALAGLVGLLRRLGVRTLGEHLNRPGGGHHEIGHEVNRRFRER